MTHCVHSLHSGSDFWNGRIYSRTSQFKAEWCLGLKAKSCHAKIVWGGHDGAGVLFILGIPFLFDLYLTLPWAHRGKEYETGLAIHSNALWIYPASWLWETNSRDPWYRKAHAFYFPWDLNWHRTEVLSLDLQRVVWSETRGIQKDFFRDQKHRQAAEDSNSISFPYRYTRKNGEIQDVSALVTVSRMFHRARWYPFIPRRKTVTYINVRFSSEVGEGTGSWKGGTIGCSYDMLPGELPGDTLARMERNRKFTR